MNGLVKRTYCVVPSEVLKSLFFTGVIGVILVSVARLASISIPAQLIVGLIGFFFVGGILVLHGLSILRKPGLVLLVGTASISAAIQLQHAILHLL